MTRRILVADDQSVHRDMVTRAISSAKLHPAPEVVHARNGREALEALDHGVDVAFLDIRMPGMTGLDVVAKWRATDRGAETPIFIVSSSSDPRDLAAAQAAGVTGYIEKGRYPDLRARIVATLHDLWPTGPDPTDGNP